MKKITCYVILLILLVGATVIVFKKMKDDTDESPKPDINETIDIIGKTYNKVIIKNVTSTENDVDIDAGIYNYGDVSRDGVINEYDLNMMNLMIETGISNEYQKALADLNKDDVVNDIDVSILTNYLEFNSELIYNTKSKELLYAISDINSLSSLNWQNTASFKLYDEKNYYVFAKYKEDISQPYEFNYRYYDSFDE